MGTIIFRHWWAFLVRGMLAILFGLVALFWPRLTLEVLVICFGAFALINGIFMLVVALGDRRMHARWGVLLVEGLVGIAIGLLTLFWPLITALVLLSLVAIWALVSGGLEIAVALWMHYSMGNEWLLLVSGVASLLLGILLIAFPQAGLQALTWLIGIYALIFGILLVFLGLQWRWFQRKMVTM